MKFIIVFSVLLISWAFAQRMLQANLQNNQLEVQMGDKHLSLSMNPLVLTVQERDDPQESYSIGLQKILQLSANAPNFTNIVMYPDSLIDISSIQWNMGQPQLLEGNSVMQFNISGSYNTSEILQMDLMVNLRRDMIVMNFKFSNFTNLWVSDANSLTLWFNIENRRDGDVMRDMNEIQQMGFNMIHSSMHPDDGLLFLAKTIDVDGQQKGIEHFLHPKDNTNSEMICCIPKFQNMVNVPYILKF